MFGIDDLALAAGAASAIGGIASWFGGRSANESNAKSAREQMEFQERMSNSAWQRGVADMRKAGLNPMLAFTQGPASSPSGSMSTSTNAAAGIPHAINQGIGSAIQLQQLKTNMDNTAANTELAKAQALQSHSQAALNVTSSARNVAETKATSSMQDKRDIYNVPYKILNKIAQSKYPSMMINNPISSATNLFHSAKSWYDKAKKSYHY